jgi:hypothetical protein
MVAEMRVDVGGFGGYFDDGFPRVSKCCKRVKRAIKRVVTTDTNSEMSKKGQQIRETLKILSTVGTLTDL